MTYVDSTSHLRNLAESSMSTDLVLRPSLSLGGVAVVNCRHSIDSCGRYLERMYQLRFRSSMRTSKAIGVSSISEEGEQHEALLSHLTLASAGWKKTCTQWSPT